MIEPARIEGGGLEGGLAVLGGPYSNHLALRAVLEDARARGAAAIVCLGDLGGFGPNPGRVFPLLEEFGVVSIAGNYDRSLAARLSDCGCGYTHPDDNRYARLSYDYTNRKTTDAERARLAALPEAARFSRGGRRYHLCHGSPRRTNEFLWDSASSDAFLARLAREAGADTILCTHTGLHWQRRLPGGARVINVGAVGRPANDGRTEVWYAWLAPGREEAEFVPVPYDHEALALEMEAEGLPAPFVETIRTGWWTTCLEILPAKERARGRF
ncbi:MAG TPA: metallophosphoesterase family protein [Acidobacteriota bacterium]|nr:metallophosphoesterase family protein [Acidobacteriota bacterium]